MAHERFRFREDVLRTAASRTRRRLLLSLIGTAAAVVGVWAAVLRPRGGTAGSLVFALALLGLLAVLSLRRRLRRLVARWSSFEVAVGEEGIGREVDGFAPIAIPRAEVAAVEERAAGIVVRGRSGASLLVPRELHGYERVRELLAAWEPPGEGSGQPFGYSRARDVATVTSPSHDGTAVAGLAEERAVPGGGRPRD